MNQTEEQAFERGSRGAWVTCLQICLQRLGYDDPQAKKTAWILEREAAVAQLRMLCETYGDNDWDETLHLADIIDKHLGRLLDNGR